MLSIKTSYLFLVVLIIAILSAVVIFISSQKNNSSYFKNATLEYKIGSYIVTDDKSTLFFPAILKSQKIENNNLTLTVESKKENGTSYSKNIIVFKEGKNNKLFIKKLDSPVNINRFTLLKISNVNEAEKEMNKQIGNYILLSIPLNESIKLGLPKQYKEYISCNDDLLNSAQNNSEIKSCSAFSAEIFIHE